MMNRLSADPQTQALDLLGAVRLRVEDEALVWPDPAMAARLLKCRISNLPTHNIVLTDMIPSDDATSRKRAQHSLTWMGARYRSTYDLALGTGETIRVEETGMRLSAPDQPLILSAVIRPIIDRQREIARAAHRAFHDDITDLPNRRGLQSSLATLASLSREHGFDWGLAGYRVANLDAINRTYGFDVGDSVMRALADRMDVIAVCGQPLGALGQDGFVIALSGDGIIDRARDLARDLAATEITGAFGTVGVSLTCGMSNAPDSPNTAFAQVTAALDAGQTFCVFNADNVRASSVRRDVDGAAILDALNDRRISLAFQPIISARTRRLHHYECLLRLRGLDGQIRPAGQFIVAAERLGLVHLLDRRALELAATALRDDPGLHLAVNVSAGTITDADSADGYLAALRAMGDDATRLGIELTETLALDDPGLASRFAASASSMGVSFAIDDFGSGHTSFHNLMAIEAGTIKIDGRYIENISTHPQNQAFIRMMVDMAQTFGVQTVAECVDDPADAALLDRLGVDYLQGYMFGLPMAAPSWRKAA